jgi:hypothetical protein
MKRKDTTAIEESRHSERLVDLVSNETETATAVVERVLDLFNELAVHEAEPYLIDGKVTVGWLSNIIWDEPPEILLPHALWHKVEDLDFDLVNLIEPIKRAWLRVYSFPYPTLACFRRIDPDDQEAGFERYFAQQPTEQP